MENQFRHTRLSRAAALWGLLTGAGAAGALGDVGRASELRISPMVWEAPLVCPLAAAGWRSTPFQGRPANQVDCAEGALRLRSEGSISMHYITPPARLSRAQALRWRWRVDRSGGASDLGRRGADDRDLAVLVAFKYNPKTATPMERALRPIVSAHGGENAPGRVLAYTWAGGDGSNTEAGDQPVPIRSPYGGRAHRIMVLQRGAGPWRSEHVDIRRDHVRAFGDDRFEIQYVAVVADTDDLGGASDAWIRDLRLAKNGAVSTDAP
ncbi:MAG: DUF3047 domain-containing protein [Pseudomonadota bacterium]